ncbi:Putative LRR receptor-like serine/threonine-protein kinase RKF3 [Glycine soja]|uniref:non-specific serine/threonine protein kinase n=1 Tax=Glycine soja TaxID=3848 RepID=A0A0B2SKI7_GLYSO|nr:Putative LRR receptor-like serine/threonine-protein kinase RKF3 [Glycine soja]
MPLFVFLATIFLTLPTLSLSVTSCLLNTTLLRSRPSSSVDSATRCRYILQTIRVLQSDYLHRTGFFFPPSSSSFSCWNTLQSSINQYDIRSSCNLPSSSISLSCNNITTKSQFENSLPNSALKPVWSTCNQSLKSSLACSQCNKTLSKLDSFLTEPSTGELVDCKAIASIYAASFSDPQDSGTANCLFNFGFSSSVSSGKRRNIPVVVFSVLAFFLLVFGALWAYFRFKQKQKKKDIGKIEMGLGSGLDSGFDSLNQSTTLIRFTFDEIKKASRNFAGDNIIGKGGYGNVYKGVLFDGTRVALKRFKNCSVAGDASFTHEVEVIASVRHVNLVALRGYCTATTNLEGHQRIIVTDLMENGSLCDHLFGSAKKKLSWSIRQKIAFGTARGLAYLHYGAQPSIIHRDIKSSNILLDHNFEAKVADFGLAKFNPEGMTHMSTRVAGTKGYVAPEYALYGQLTERSDVFSFGVVLLELLSGKKALHVDNDGQPSALTDFAWSLVRNGKALDVIEDGMPELGPIEVLEKYVLVAVLCCHPQLYARPTMDQVVKMLETEELEQPISSIAGRIDVDEKSVSKVNMAIKEDVEGGTQNGIREPATCGGTEPPCKQRASMDGLL